MTAASAAEHLNTGSGEYPVQLSFDPEQRLNRMWGIPIIGMTVRWIALIPHLVVAWVLSIVLGLLVLVSWIPVLILGRQPLAGVFAKIFRYLARTVAWGLFLAGPYPPFSWSAAYPVNLDMPGDGSINRLWGIPFLGIWLRGVILIPHFIVLFFLGIAVYAGIFVLWIPILINGRMATLGYAVYGGFLRLYARVYLYLILAPVPYPPLLP